MKITYSEPVKGGVVRAVIVSTTEVHGRLAWLVAILAAIRLIRWETSAIITEEPLTQ